jgi:LuxR family maltose regulon positive regulatory protein
MVKRHPTHSIPLDRRIIDRPRLLAALDETNERITLAVAPAGYGKTTLARQWIRNSNLAWGWIRATPASADVVFLASAIGSAVAAHVPSLAPRIEARGGTLTNPEVEAHGLAEIVAEELSGASIEVGLIFDDAHLIGSTPAVSLFMETLIAISKRRMIVLSRRRPSWLPTRYAIYGEMLELQRGELAFTPDEARTVLQTARKPDDVDRLIDLARGWPAVIGLASMNPSFSLPSDGLPSALYDYVAEELYREFDESLRPELLRLSAIPDLDRRAATKILGSRGSEALTAGVRHGFISPDPLAGYEIHPLARAFFHEKLLEDPVYKDGVQDIVGVLLDDGLVDEAFETIRKFGLHGMLPRLFEQHRKLLNSGRLSTLEVWVSYTSENGVHFPLLDLADAELERRRGRLAAAEALALQAAQGLPAHSDDIAHAYAIAGECAFYNPRRLRESLAFHEHAEKLAHTNEAVERALWGQILAAHEITDEDERPYAERFLALRTGDPNHELRAAGVKTSVAVHLLGRVLDTAQEVERVEDVLSRATDPLARSFYLYRVAYVNLLATRYTNAARFASAARDEVERERLQFARAHVLSVVAAVQLGLRRLARAEAAIETAADVADDLDDSFEVVNTRALRAKLLLARHDPAGALAAMPLILLDDVLPAMAGEYLSLRAVVLAVIGSPGEARATAARASETTLEVQTRCYVALVDALLDDASNDAREGSFLRNAVSIVEETQALDTLVTTVRAAPGIIPRLLEIGHNGLLAGMLRASNDDALAVKYRIELPGVVRMRTPLTRREREVLALVCEGLKNREIAGRLYLSEATVKLHVRRILAKTGARSRTEAVLRSQGESLGGE